MGVAERCQTPKQRVHENHPTARFDGDVVNIQIACRVAHLGDKESIVARNVVARLNHILKSPHLVQR